MISKGKHQKHAKLCFPDYGYYGRNELGILGTACSSIRALSGMLIHKLGDQYDMVYVDADHQSGDSLEQDKTFQESILSMDRAMEFTDKILYNRMDFNRKINEFEQRTLFNQQDMVLINSNHFPAKEQILVIDPKKSLEKKTHKIKEVKLLLTLDQKKDIPGYLRELLPDWEKIPVLCMEEEEAILEWVRDWMKERVPAVNGLVLAGGESRRMKRDKGKLVYHGSEQREYMHRLLQPLCKEVYLSCNASQVSELKLKYNIIEDSFLGLGPFGGILSAFRHNPNTAWLTVACDMPYLSGKTLDFLLANRNPSRLATSFLDPKEEFPEPLVTIWEPKSYPVLLQFLSQGYSCPRKVLINTDIELLHAPDTGEFRNVNYPEEYEQVVRDMDKESL